jgi:hypothetical protein
MEDDDRIKIIYWKTLEVEVIDENRDTTNQVNALTGFKLWYR